MQQTKIPIASLIGIAILLVMGIIAAIMYSDNKKNDEYLLAKVNQVIARNFDLDGDYHSGNAWYIKSNGEVTFYKCKSLSGEVEEVKYKLTSEQLEKVKNTLNKKVNSKYNSDVVENYDLDTWRIEHYNKDELIGDYSGNIENDKKELKEMIKILESLLNN